MLPTPYPELNQVLDALVSDIQQILEQTFVGAYLQGSFAVGDFDQHSDVDFVIAIEDELTSPQVEDLQRMHERIYRLDSEWAKHLEGSYFPRQILRNQSEVGRELWYLDHGAHSLVRSDHCNTLLVRWVVRQNGVALAGPSPQTLVDPISTASLKKEIFDVINNWGMQIIGDPTPYMNRFYQSFIVLSYCRMLHDLNRGYPGSKQEGAKWAKSVLDPSWSDLIDAAWDGRPDPARKVKEPPDSQDFERTLEFVEYITKESPFYVGENDPDLWV
jgi:predicted nucleotidyltransferase